MIRKWIIYIVLTITPFLCLPGMDSRVPKTEFLAVMMSFLCVWSLYKGNKLERISNKWLVVFLGLLPFNIWLAPKMRLDKTFIIASHSYLFKTSLYIVLFVLSFLAIKNYWKETKDKNIIKIMIWTGFIMSCYCILQAFGYDQWFHVKNGLYLGEKSLFEMIKSLDSYRGLGGTLGHATIVSPFIGLTVPLAFKYKKYFKAATMLVAVFLCFSMVAFVSAFLALLAFVCLKYKQNALKVLIAGLLFFSLAGYLAHKKGLVNDNGRFGQWKLVYEAHKSPVAKGLDKKYCLTGLGAGSFKYIFPSNYKSTYHQAHNEYLEVLFNHGLFGFVVFLGFIIVWFKDNRLKCPYLLSSLIYICVCAAGTFVWHIAPISLYTITLKAITEVENEEIA